MPTDPPAAPKSHLREVAALFLRLGFTAFGGPAAHVALMEDEVVTRRRWLDRRHFLDLVALVNFVPGPNSTELAIHLGLVRAGFRGLVAAGVCFITPAVLIILPLAFAYVRYGEMPRLQVILRDINAGLIAVLAVATYRFARTSVRDRFTATVALLAAAGAFLGHWKSIPQSELITLALAAAAGAAPHLLRRPRPNGTLCLLPPSLLLAQPQSPHWLLSLVLFFLQVGSTLFGSGYVLVSYLHAGLVEQRHWLTERQLLDAVAVGQVTPGPLLTTATFVGYLVAHRYTGSAAWGVVGAVAATAAIFLPAFVFIALLGKWLPNLRQIPAARGALDATNAAVAALVFVVTATLAWDVLRGPYPVALAAVAFLALVSLNLNATWVMLGAAAAGFVRGYWNG
jgi:chromate transporter